jgi:hypothetical protein
VFLNQQGLALPAIGWVVGSYGMTWGVAQLLTGHWSDLVGRHGHGSPNRLGHGPNLSAAVSELADQVKAGAQKIMTKKSDRYVPFIDADRLDYDHWPWRKHTHLLLIDDAKRGLADFSG